MIDEIVIQPASGSENLDLVHAMRYEVLRKPHGLSPVSATFEGDRLDSTMHFLAVHKNQMVGCVSILFDPSKTEAQLRGMAVQAELQGFGIGKRILEAAHSAALHANKSLWCNARCSAVGFYERYGWKKEGDLFEIPRIGPHWVMRWQISLKKTEQS